MLVNGPRDGRLVGGEATNELALRHPAQRLVSHGRAPWDAAGDRRRAGGACSVKAEASQDGLFDGARQRAGQRAAAS